MTRKELHDYLLGLPKTKLDFPFDDVTATYKTCIGAEENNEDWKIFAIMPDNKDPINISLKCDPNLAIVLREKYESVMEGYHLNKKHWNTMILTGQLEDQEVVDLINHSYDLVAGNK